MFRKFSFFRPLCRVGLFKALPNGVLNVFVYDSLDFHSNLMISLSSNKEIRSMSYSYFRGVVSFEENFSFILNFYDKSPEINLILTTGIPDKDITVNENVKVTPETINDMHYSVFDLYLHSLQRAKETLDAKPLLIGLSTCVRNYHYEVLRESANIPSDIFPSSKISSKFIKSLSAQFNQELCRLENEKMNSVGARG